jgi:hypothetical protein
MTTGASERERCRRPQSVCGHWLGRDLANTVGAADVSRCDEFHDNVGGVVAGVNVEERHG